MSERALTEGEIILAIFYPPVKYIGGCVWLSLQAQEGTTYFTELAERVEYGNYGNISFGGWGGAARKRDGERWRLAPAQARRGNS